MTNGEARFSNSLRPRKPEGSLGRTAQDAATSTLTHLLNYDGFMICDACLCCLSERVLDACRCDVCLCCLSEWVDDAGVTCVCVAFHDA